MTAQGKFQRGKVKWFSDEKGYGFIQPDIGGKDLFVHWKGILGHGRKNLAEGQSVEFEAVDTEKGPQAINVKAIAA
jgi:CspA family cold shock protein